MDDRSRHDESPFFVFLPPERGLDSQFVVLSELFEYRLASLNFFATNCALTI